ncbi:hypothetical protein TRVA0_042S00650 [Trichomonascus vanleenenianus]|uniref:uncharacterized protein n=1 Tax=Trichomonascus vanleenenianus TaxID=2268995 RepID=UPI003ECAAE9E
MSTSSSSVFSESSDERGSGYPETYMPYNSNILKDVKSTNVRTDKYSHSLRRRKPVTNSKKVSYAEGTDFTIKRAPKSHTERLIEEASSAYAGNPQEFEVACNEIVANSPMAVRGDNSSTIPSSSDCYTASKFTKTSPFPQLCDLDLSPDKTLAASKLKTKRHSQLEARVTELQRDRQTLVDAYEKLSLLAEKEHARRMAAEAKASSLGLRYRIAKAKLTGYQGQMDALMAKFQQSLDSLATCHTCR